MTKILIIILVGTGLTFASCAQLFPSLSERLPASVEVMEEDKELKAIESAPAGSY